MIIDNWIEELAKVTWIEYSCVVNMLLWDFVLI